MERKKRPVAKPKKLKVGVDSQKFISKFKSTQPKLGKWFKFTLLHPVHLTIELSAIIFAIFAIIQTQNEIKLSNESRQEQIETESWSILATKSPVNSGKIKALEYLASRGEPLTDIDLSAKAMGVESETNEKGEIINYKARTYLQNLDLFKRCRFKECYFNECYFE